MVKFKSVKLNGPPQPLQIYRYWGAHRFVQVLSVTNGVVTTISFGSLHGGVFTPAKRLVKRQYVMGKSKFWLFPNNGYGCPLRPGTLVAKC
jgi:hypothetical protein